MLFSSLTFIFRFLPAALLVYAVSPKRMKNVVLLLFSLFFYAWGEPLYVFLMLATIAATYFCGLLLERFQKPPARRLVMLGGLLLLLGSLGCFKYANFFLESFHAVTGLPVPVLNIALPIGISFYTFQALSYLFDVYRNEVPAQRNPLLLATYITMFPQLVAGPIVRYQDVNDQLLSRTHTWDGMACGVKRFAVGLAKKVLVANVLGSLCEAYAASTEPSVLFAWMSAVAYALQIYFDFSGYSDMAIGLGKFFGFDFMENFNYPFISKSITEFWRRWHMSLGTWFRDYVYIPLGGSRCRLPRALFNICVVWALTGLWHGASMNFVLWGLYFAVLLMVEKLFLLKWLKKHPVVGHIYTLITVLFSFVIFQSTTLSSVTGALSSLLGINGIPLVSSETLYYLRSYAVVLILAAVCSTPLLKTLYERLSKRTVPGRILAIGEIVVPLVILVFATAYLVDGSFNPFLYFRF